MPDDEQFPIQHVFDQTNGVMPASEDGDAKTSNRAEVLRQRRQSSGLAYGMFGVGHQ